MVGIVGVSIAATTFDGTVPNSANSAVPPRPRTALVVPTNTLLDTEPIDLTVTSLPLDSPQLVSTDSTAPLPEVETALLSKYAELPPTVEPRPTPAPRPPAPSANVQPDANQPDASSHHTSGTQALQPPRYEALTTTYSDQLRLYRTLERRPETDHRIELGGLVVDETITPQGRTFYSRFFGIWKSPPTSGFYTVKVVEKPTPGRGTLVQVLVNDDTTFQARLQPQTHFADLALQAARRTYAYVRSGQGLLHVQ